MMRTKKLKFLNFIVIFLLLFSLMPNFKIQADENQNSPPTNSMVSLVGDFFKSQSLGTDWDAKNQSSIMNEFSNGLYELTVDFKTSGSFNYKAALNGSLDENYGANFQKGGNNIALNVTKKEKITFKVNLKNKTIYDSINNPASFKNSATLVGTLAQSDGSDWNLTDTSYDLNYIGDGYSTKTFSMKKGDYEYKVAYDHKWSNGEIDHNIKFSLDKDQNVTFISNPDLNLCTNSILSPNISIIGDIRNKNTDANWNEKLQGFDFKQLNNTGTYIYSAFIKEGTYQYKATLNYSWDNPIPGGTTNKSIIVPTGGKYVVFVCDVSGKNLYDSINDADKVSTALGLNPAPQTLTSPVINENGTVTFSYSNDTAKEVYLAGDFTNWATNKKSMTKNQNGVWSVTVRLGDNSSAYEYKFITDGNYVTDPSNQNVSGDGNSLLNFPKYSGRKIVVPGTMQQNVGGTNWDATSPETTMDYIGNGIYTLTLKSIPAGSYQYKVATDGTWTENYGEGAKLGGDNIEMDVPTTEDVTFWYNDDSNLIVDSTSYKKVDVKLTGTGVANNTLLTDSTFTGICSVKVPLKQGEYKDFKLTVDGKEEVPVGDLNLTSDRVVTISYDPNIDIVFTDLSDKKINTSSLYFDSKLSDYKLPYGAVPTGTNVVFNLKAAKGDLSNAYLILQTPNGTKKLSMSLNGSFTDGSDKWTVNYNPPSTEMDKYYFVVTNGYDVKAYGDDDGYFGAGAPNDLGKVKLYDMNVYDKDFKTPDWFKNAVVYQIFPDRFFNGDTSNDTALKTSRGFTNYEFYNNWYSIPEDPTLEFTSNGKPDLTYLGAKGDGLWSNEIYGGDLTGVQKKLNYLQSLGINTLYFNPISQSISNHRYDTTNYKTVDPILGSMDDYVSLAKEAHKRGMHIILDGVFNHVSDDSIYFDRYGKYVAKGKPIGAYQYWSRVYALMNSDAMSQSDAEDKVTKNLAADGITDLHYKDWFKIDNTKVTAITGDPEHYSYEGWDGYDSMPVIEALNGSEYNVTTWDTEVIDGKNADSTYWLKQGADGWRLDAQNEVSDETWGHFRTAVKGASKDNVIIGEIWTDASKYLLGNMDDSVMNYRFRDPVLGFVKGTADDNTTKYSAADAMNALETMREQYPKEAFDAMLNLVDSHDTQRVISALDGYQKGVKAIAKDTTSAALAKMKMIPLIQMTYPGTPCIYYGDEAGMPGADDPDNRRGMIWGNGNKDLVTWYATLIGIRKNNVVLATGDISPISVPDSYKSDLLAYTRDNSKDHAVIAINRRTEDIDSLTLDVTSIPDGTILTDALNTKEKYAVVNGKVTVNVPEQSGVILLSNYKAPELNLLGLKDIYDPSYIVPVKTASNSGSGSGTTPSGGNTTSGNTTSGNTASGGNTSASSTTSENTTFSNNTAGKQSNKVSAALPKTGSFIDTSLIIAVGVIFIIAGSICFFIYKRKKHIE
ncbi:alpha-amylase family glycosyl hydrolase [Clostridium akagii]|uniref:pullulanase X25 domain-containing protein n=1 Tax=Clostridium akagii TaxID=91623 RepID=UPI00068ECB59|nr:alpha-amylase family glycosyl hydrolase [Clostridium akagii]